MQGLEPDWAWQWFREKIKTELVFPPNPRAALEEIREYAGQFIGCDCGSGDYEPGDCWGCRMIHIIHIASEGLDDDRRTKEMAEGI